MNTLGSLTHAVVLFVFASSGGLTRQVSVLGLTPESASNVSESGSFGELVLHPTEMPLLNQFGPLNGNRCLVC